MGGVRFRFPIPFRTRALNARGAPSLLAAPVPTHPAPPLRRSWIALYVGATLAIAVGTGFYMGRSTEGYIAGVFENHWSALTTRPAAELSAWGSQRRAQGELLAHVARVARDTHPVNAVLLSMVGTHGCVGAWLVTATGGERAGVGAPGITPEKVIASHGEGWLAEVTSDTGGVRTIVAPHTTYLDVVAPVTPTTAGATPEAVLLRFDLTRADLPPLMPSDSAAPTPTLAKLRHTLLLARDGDSVRILRVAGGAAPSLVQRTLAFAKLPPDVRAALHGEWAFGRGPGVLDRDVMFSVRAVPGLQWAVLREASYRAVVAAASGGSIGFNRVMGALLVLGVFGVVALAFVVIRLRSAHALSRLRSDFIAGISHEVRTPLAQVRMFAELLHSRRITAPEDVERSLRIIETEAQRLSVLLDDILDFSAREHARPVVAGAVDATARVHAVVRETLEAYAPLAAERGVRVVDAVEGDAEAAINAGALRHVLTNLVANAAKYGPAGGTVTVRAGAANGRVTICVDDEGAGVPIEERERIWLPFERGRRIPTAHAAGYGIGLAVARELVARFGGTTRVEDAPGGGARFVVELPAAASAAGTSARDPLVGAA
jgi:signal transduction histidine kinase